MQAEFGKSWRVWAWLQRQFSPISLTAIAAVSAFGGGYITNLKTRVVVLETQVIPVLQDTAAVTTLKAKVEDHAGRIDRLEKDYDVAYRESNTPPVAHKRAK